ncbi:MAG: hypothetical protein PHC53_04950 [Patescibacteria group bacterium]|nr:hypothetical protein [Patescibacteria group bacterium]
MKKPDDPHMNWVLTPDKIEELRKKGEMPPAPPEDLSARKTLRESPESKLKAKLVPFLEKEILKLKQDMQARKAHIGNMQKPNIRRKQGPGIELPVFNPAEIEEEEKAYLVAGMHRDCLKEALNNLNTGKPLPPDFLTILHGIERQKAEVLSASYKVRKSNPDSLSEERKDLNEVAEMIDALEKR